VALVRERTKPTERLPLVGEVSDNFCGQRGVAWSVRRIPYGRNLGFLDRVYLNTAYIKNCYAEGIHSDPNISNIFLTCLVNESFTAQTHILSYRQCCGSMVIPNMSCYMKLVDTKWARYVERNAAQRTAVR
jgi:hypothetical protein